MPTQQATLEFLDQQDEQLTYLAREIWAHPEVALTERFACTLLADQLTAAGFAGEREVGQLPTAFVASWGSGLSKRNEGLMDFVADSNNDVQTMANSITCRRQPSCGIA